jgi:phosphoserine phosphatase
VSLASWNDGAARSAIEDYLARIEAVPREERIAVIDNDGTLWCEKPDYAQALFLMAEAAARPQVAAELAAANERGFEAVVGVLMGIHAGLTPEEFWAAAAGWFAEARHPRFGVPFDALAYVPMLELLDLLRAHDFRVFIVTGGGVEFVRVVSERVYGVAPDDVVGSAVQTTFERRDGRVVLVRQPKLLGSPNEGAPKAVNIQAHIGQRPIVAIGNSAGDREMLEYAHTGERPSLCLVIDHDDAEREYAYAGASVTDPGAEAIADTAAAQGWTMVSMRDDWKRVFAHV